jgi:hypothetical protein
MVLGTFFSHTVGAGLPSHVVIACLGRAHVVAAEACDHCVEDTCARGWWIATQGGNDVNDHSKSRSTTWLCVRQTGCTYMQ